MPAWLGETFSLLTTCEIFCLKMTPESHFQAENLKIFDFLFNTHTSLPWFRVREVLKMRAINSRIKLAPIGSFLKKISGQKTWKNRPKFRFFLYTLYILPIYTIPRSFLRFKTNSNIKLATTRINFYKIEIAWSNLIFEQFPKIRYEENRNL
jgi:hypothetical protein